MRKFCALFYARQKFEEANGVTELFFKFTFNYSCIIVEVFYLLVVDTFVQLLSSEEIFLLFF